MVVRFLLLYRTLRKSTYSEKTMETLREGTRVVVLERKSMSDVGQDFTNNDLRKMKTEYTFSHNEGNVL